MTRTPLDSPNTDGQELEIRRIFNAPRELVFKAWSDRHHLESWFAPVGCTLEIKKLEFCTGGQFHQCIRNPQFGECWTIGRYLEITAPDRIVCTMALADSEGQPIDAIAAGHAPEWPSETRLTVTFKEWNGQTHLTLHQTVDQNLAKRTGAYPSWIQMLDRLSAVVENTI